MTRIAFLHILSMFYLSFLTCYVISILDPQADDALWKTVFRRWRKLLGGLFAIGIVVMIFTWI